MFKKAFFLFLTGGGFFLFSCAVPNTHPNFNPPPVKKQQQQQRKDKDEFGEVLNYLLNYSVDKDFFLFP